MDDTVSWKREVVGATRGVFSRTLLWYCGIVLLLLTQCLRCGAVQQGDDGEAPRADASPGPAQLGKPLNPGDGAVALTEAAAVPNASSADDTTTSGPAAPEDPDEQTLRTLAYWMNAVLTNVIVVLGTVSNSLTIVILTRRAMRSSTNIYLSALAVWDIIVLLCTALLIGLEAIPECVAYRQFAYAYIVSYIYPVALIAQTATIWLTVSFTVERFIAVCHPLKAARMCTIKRAKIVIFGVSLGATLYNIPRWFEYRAVRFFDKGTNQTINVVQPTSFVENPLYTQIYFSWLYVPIMCIIPLVTLAILNTCLVLAVRRSQKQRKDMNVRQSRENNVTIMLASVVVVFIFCQVPALVYNLAYAVDREYVEQRSRGYRVLSVMRNFLVTFNSAINFLLYCALGQKFRRIFIHTFCKRCINDTYMPMSGIHQHMTAAQFGGAAHYGGGNPHHPHAAKPARQYCGNSHAMMLVRDKGGARGGLTPDALTSCSTATTTTTLPPTLTSSSREESALLDPGPAVTSTEPREVNPQT